jgi:transposase
MFYYVRMDELIPESRLLRLLRLVDKHIDLSFIRSKVKHLYSHTGRPSIDPEVLLRMLLIGYLYGITSERRLCEEVKMHIGYRWFVGLSLEDKIPDHSTFSKNRHERFHEGDLFQQIFDEIVQRCISHGFVTGNHLTVDSTYIKHRIIIGADAGSPDKKTDCDAAVRQIQRVKWSYRLKPKTLGADKGYAAGEFINTLLKENILPHIPISEHLRHTAVGIFPRERFQYDQERDVFLCPEEKELTYWGIHKSSRQHVYRARKKDCQLCLKKPECTKDQARSVSYHIYETSINKAKALNRTREYRISQRMRKQIEELFGEAKEFMGLRRARYRGLRFVREQVLMTATAQNIKRMVTLLSRGGPKAAAMAIKQRIKGKHDQELSVFVGRLIQFIADMFRIKAACFAKA